MKTWFLNTTLLSISAFVQTLITRPFINSGFLAILGINRI